MNLLPMLVAVGVLLFSGFLAYLQYNALVSDDQKERHSATAKNLAAHLAGRLHALSDMVGKFAIADTALVGAIQSQDLPALRAREASILQNFPDANRVRFILPGDSQVDNTVNPPLSYACLELARLTELNQETPPFEVHLFGGEIEHMDMPRPVMHDGKVIASLIVTQDVNNLRKWVEDLQTEGGYVELHQGVEDEVISLFGQGDSSLQESGAPYTAPIENSYWQINYWPATGIGTVEARYAGFITTFTVAAGVLIAFFFSYGTFISSMVSNDLRRMVGFIIDVSLGKRFQNYPVRLSEVKKVLKDREADLTVLTDYTNTRETIHDKAEQYMADITFREENISVEEIVPPKPHDESGDKNS